MSTRCVVRVITESNPTIKYLDKKITHPLNFLSLPKVEFKDLYHHFDGYPSGVGLDLQKTLALFNQKGGGDGKALLKYIRKDESYQPTERVEADIDYFYLVRIDEKGKAVVDCYDAGSQWKKAKDNYIPEEMSFAEEFY